MIDIKVSDRVLRSGIRRAVYYRENYFGGLEKFTMFTGKRQQAGKRDFLGVMCRDCWTFHQSDGACRSGISLDDLALYLTKSS